MTIQFEESSSSNNVKNLFYQTPQMAQDYLKWSDTGVMLNFRLVKTRFKRFMLLFCGMCGRGRTVIFAVAFLKDEKIACL